MTSRDNPFSAGTAEPLSPDDQKGAGASPPPGSSPPATPQGDGFDSPPPASPDDASGGVVSGDDVQRQLDEHRDRYLRLAAEFDNHRRRSAKQNLEAGSRAQADLVKQLLDALDDLARFAHVDPASTDATTIVEGVQMVERKVLKALSGAGLETVDPEGEAFDPSRHEAVATEPAGGHDDENRVARVYQRGYVFGGQLLRPARVVVKQ